MRIEADTVEDYISKLPEDRKDALMTLRHTILENIPSGFEERIQYSMPSFVVPLSLYPAGYHVTKDCPLPFISFASQKHFVGLYHMGIYADEGLLNWFTTEYPRHSKRKLDMGKSCIRFKKIDEIPYDLIAELVAKVTPEDWIKSYEKQVKR